MSWNDIWKIVRWRLFLPLLHLHIQIPLFEIRTSLMSDSNTSYIRDYVSVLVRFWKWKFEFALYDTMQRKVQRKK